MPPSAQYAFDLFRNIIHWKHSVPFEKHEDIFNELDVGQFSCITKELNTQLGLVHWEIKKFEHLLQPCREDSNQTSDENMINSAFHLEAHCNVEKIQAVIEKCRTENELNLRDPGLSKDDAIDILEYFRLVRQNAEIDRRSALDAKLQTKLPDRWLNFKKLFFERKFKDTFKECWKVKDSLTPEAFEERSLNIYGKCVTYLALRHLQHEIMHRLEKSANTLAETVGFHRNNLNASAQDIKNVIGIFQKSEDHWSEAMQILSNFDFSTLHECCKVLTIHAFIRTIKLEIIRVSQYPLQRELGSFPSLKEKLKILYSDTQDLPVRREKFSRFVRSVQTHYGSQTLALDRVAYEDLDKNDFSSKFKIYNLLSSYDGKANDQFNAYLNRFKDHLKFLLPFGVFSPFAEPLPSYEG